MLIAVLLAASLAGGLLFLWIARVLSRPAEIREARGRVQGLLLEMWLFGDEPRQVARTQWELIRANARYASLLAPTAIACAAPMIAMWFLLDPLLGKMPIPPAGTVIVTAPLGSVAPVLSVPEGFRVETPPVRIAAEGIAIWRVRADREAEGELRIGPARQMIVASRQPRHLGARWKFAAEYPDRSIRISGVEWRWEAWFFVFSAITVLVFRRRFGVVF